MFFTLILISPIYGYTLSDTNFTVVTGSGGDITSLKLTGDTYPTEYVLNGSSQKTRIGQILFTYRLGNGTWTKAATSASSDAMTQEQDGKTITVTYQNSTASQGIKNFKLVETYSLNNGYLSWEMSITNTAEQDIEFGDIGFPLPFNQTWPGNEVIYETHCLKHSFVANNASYIYVLRPSGIGPFLLLTPDPATDAGLEYQDIGTYYIHSNRIKSTGRGYLPNTSLTLAPNQTKVYAFKFFKVASMDALKEKLYAENLIDFNVVPGMIVPTNMTAKFDLHTTNTIDSVTAQYPQETAIAPLGTTPADHKLYRVKFNRLGQNNITVYYAAGRKTVLQYWIIAPVDSAIQQHAAFMTEKQVSAPGKVYDKAFDDWNMDTKSTRNLWDGYWGWGDDWGYPHGEFLAEKNVYFPVASEVTALDHYLKTTIWDNLMDGHHTDFLIHDFIQDPPPNTQPVYRGYAYPHIYNTFFSMYKIAKLYPDLITYTQPRDTLLFRAGSIFKALYSSGVSYNWDTGLMGEQTNPEIIKALQDAGFASLASTLTSYMTRKYNNIKNTPYPYGSEYSFDNTGEEGCYTVAKMNNNTDIMQKVVNKSLACRGSAPVWYYYIDPTTTCGETWWNFQYTTALAGYCLDDWARNYSTTPEKDLRLAYATKIACIAYINSGQIDADPENIGASAWTYQAQLGTRAIGERAGLGDGNLHNGWWPLTGESDLGLFGALRIISADVSNDPVFGLLGYGCEVTENGTRYVIIPRDGLFKRLNMVSLKMSLVLEQDQYDSAVIGAAKEYIEFNLKNVKTTAHATKVSIKGLNPGTYHVMVDGVNADTFTASVDSVSDVVINLGTNALYNVRIQTATSAMGKNKRRFFSRRLIINRCGNGYMMRLLPFDPQAAPLLLRIFNSKGRLVTTLDDIKNGTFVWRPTGSRLPPGVYIARVTRHKEIAVTGQLLPVK